MLTRELTDVQAHAVLQSATSTNHPELWVRAQAGAHMPDSACLPADGNAGQLLPQLWLDFDLRIPGHFHLRSRRRVRVTIPSSTEPALITHSAVS